MKKYLICLAALTLVIAGVLTGCGMGKDDTDTSTTSTTTTTTTTMTTMRDTTNDGVISDKSEDNDSSSRSVTDKTITTTAD